MLIIQVDTMQVYHQQRSKFYCYDDKLDPTTNKDVVGSIDAQSELAKNYLVSLLILSQTVYDF